MGDTAARFAGFLLYLAAFVGFIAAGLALIDWLIPHDLWTTLAIIAAVVSTITVI